MVSGGLFYDERRVGSGDEFLDETQRLIDFAVGNPEASFRPDSKRMLCISPWTSSAGSATSIRRSSKVTVRRNAGRSIRRRPGNCTIGFAGRVW